MKKKSVHLKALKLTKDAICSLQRQHAITGGGSNNQLCFPPDDGGTRPPDDGTRLSNNCVSQGLCQPRDTELCYSGRVYISQCCV